MKDLPPILSPIIQMDYPNESVNFQKGEFILTWENNDYAVSGGLYLNWTPSIHVDFKGKFEPNTKRIDFKTFGSSMIIEIKSEKLNFRSKGVLKKIRVESNEIECLLTEPVNIGNIDEPVEYIRFELTNQEQRAGCLIQTSKNSASLNRLELKDDKYKIIIDQHVDLILKKSDLERTGGYQFLSSVKIEVENNDTFKLKEIESTLIKFSAYIQFLNARKCPQLIVYGFSNDKVIWKRVQALESDSYEYYNGWVLKHKDMKLYKIWDKFCEIWRSENDQESIQIILDWYNEANKKKISLEGRIVLVQNALELMFNWLMSEKYKYITANDANNMSAAAKIGFLLSFFQIESRISENLVELIKYAKEYNYVNSPETFVNIRNIIVHSNQKKRLKMKKLTNQAKEEALNLGIWYVEILLMKLLGYKGLYNNRCAGICDAEDKI